LVIRYAVPDDVDTEFRLFINQKYDGKPKIGFFKKSVLMREVCLALRQYMRISRQRDQINTHTQTQIHKNITNDSDVPKSVLYKRDKMVAYLESGYYHDSDLLKKYSDTGRRVSLSDLRKAIGYACGTDQRIIDKWCYQLKTVYHLIREVSTKQF
jgi:hypothetical protein